MTRMGTAAIIRAQFSKALEYLDKQNKADAEEDTDPPDFDPKLEALLPALREVCAFEVWGPAPRMGQTVIRLVASFATTEADVEGLLTHFPL